MASAQGQRPSGFPPGWYRDPQGIRPQRWWDGAQWTQSTRDPESGLITAGWITAFLFPIAGFIIGIVLLARSRAGHGIGVLAVSIAVPFLALGSLTEEFTGDTSGDDTGQSIEEEINRDLGLIDEPPVRGKLGETLTLTRGDLSIEVRVRKVIDPLPAGEFDEPEGGSDHRFVGVETKAKNFGRESYDAGLSGDVSLITTGDRDAKEAAIFEGDCSSSDAALTPGDSRAECFPFEVKAGREAKEVRVRLTSEEGGTATGIWTVPPSTSGSIGEG